jgi:hypothetical protein
LFTVFSSCCAGTPLFDVFIYCARALLTTLWLF